MSFNLTGIPGVLMAANAVTHAKGQELFKESSTEKQEKNRMGRQIFLTAKAEKEQQKAAGAQKGMLA